MSTKYLESLVSDVLDIRKHRPEAIGKTGVPKVNRKRGERTISSLKEYKDIADMVSKEGLLSVSDNDIKEGATLIHMVRNQSNFHRGNNGFRATLTPVVLLTDTTCPRVRFANGLTKIVKRYSLYKKLKDK